MFSKRTICILSAALMLALAQPGHAQGEIRCWTTKADSYYHIEKSCGQEEERFPISETAALKFEKMPCPECVKGKDEETPIEEVLVVMRAGTYVARIPQSALDACQTDGEQRAENPQIHTLNALQNWMPEEQYRLLKASYQADGSAETRFRAAGIAASEDEIEMSARYVDGAWYLAVRPQTAYSDGNPMRWQALDYQVRIESDGSVFAELTGNSKAGEKYETKEWSGAAAVFRKDYGGLDIDVYRELNANIAVVHEKDADPVLLQSRLRINENELGIPMNGYMSGENTATYCCVISDAELGMLVSGKTPKILHTPSAEGVVFDNGDCAPVRLGTGGVGLIDKDGVLMTDVFYQSISRCIDSEMADTGPTPWFCMDENGTIHIFAPNGFDQGTLDHIESFPGAIRAYYENPAICVLRMEESYQVVSLQGEGLLWEIPVTGEFSSASGKTFNKCSVDGKFRNFIKGLPECLVVTLEGEAGEVAWLAHNRGKRISEDFRRIIPLVWKDNSGVFSFEPLNGPEGKIGLMDHNGNILADAEYDAVEVVSPERFEMVKGFEKNTIIIK